LLNPRDLGGFLFFCGLDVPFGWLPLSSVDVDRRRPTERATRMSVEGERSLEVHQLAVAGRSLQR
ncbi:hypothetical protein AB0K24_04560, partial [Streptomyces mirabilis]|uniref:hypothetical protein n=1 Tax=Streptomyces mirabilis TaxID=68239 RepID=UPI00342AA87C